MPASAFVEIHYGPYEACGIVDYSTSRLEGLLMVLQKHGHTSDLTQIKDRNVVELHVNGELVFHCDIRHLKYGGDGELDPLCAEALKLVTKAF